MNTTLGYMTIALFAGDGSQVGPASRHELVSTTPEQHRLDLLRRRAARNPVAFPNGLEFDTYAPGCVPGPELEGCRTRITFSS